MFINNCCFREAIELFKNRKIVEAQKGKLYYSFYLQRIENYKDDISINILVKMTEGIVMKKLTKNKIETKLEPVALNDIELQKLIYFQYMPNKFFTLWQLSQFNMPSQHSWLSFSLNFSEGH